MRIIPLFFVLGALCSCAGIKHEVGWDNSARSERSGFRYYAPAWFILAYVNGHGQVISEPMILPDTTKPMSIMPFADLASNTSTLSFQNGMLVSATAQVDATEVPTAIIEAAKKVVKAYLSPKTSVADTAEPIREKIDTVRGPYLYKLVRDGKDWSKLVGDGGHVLQLPVAREPTSNVKSDAESESNTNNTSGTE